MSIELALEKQKFQEMEKAVYLMKSQFMNILEEVRIYAEENDFDAIMGIIEEVNLGRTETGDEYRPDILRFASSMNFKMEKNKDKPHKDLNPDNKGRTYSETPVDVLFQRLLDEVQELDEAIKSESNQAVQYECADVGNFAMMIHENIMKRPE